MTYVYHRMLEALRAMDEPNDNQATQLISHSRNAADTPKPRQVQAQAAATDPVVSPNDIITTITLKPGAKITIEYPR